MTSASIYLRKSGKVILPVGTGEPTWQGVGTIAKNLQSLGFGLSSALLDRLARLPDEFIAEWYKQLLPTLKEMVGSHRTFRPMYPNFPKQVMDATEAELFFNAMTHYYGFMLSDMLGDPNLVMLPHYEKESRSTLDEFHDLRWLDLGSEEDFHAIFTRLVSSNGSLSDSDKKILRWFVSNRDIADLLPEQIPQKETLAFLVAILPQPDCLISKIKTATDILRVAVAMSNGDVSLAEPTKFRNFAKRERRFLLGCLEQCGSSMTEDILRWKDRWIRLGARGSKFDLPAGNTVRFFCWWKNIGGDDNGRVDVDLSASLFDSEWQYQTDVAYYNLREGQCYHSGDITSAPNGACEFIDMNLPSVLEMNARYIVMSAMCFTGQSFVEMPECFGGWMMRQNPNSGEIFEARTVRDKVDITSTVRLCVPVIIDVKERKVYWADLGLKGRGQINNAARNSVGMSQIGRAIVELNKPNLFDLFLMHAEARGIVVETKQEADSVFDVFDGTITAFDADKILSDFLA